MTQVLPEQVRDEIQKKLWATADSLNWMALPDSRRSSWYQHWTNDPTIGGVLSHFMDPRKVRVYIKDSLLKPYFEARAKYDLSAILAQLGEPEAIAIERYTKPLGVRLVDRRILCWGNSRDWKLILMACFERAALSSGTAHAILLLETGRTVDLGRRQLVETAGGRLGIEHIVWLEGH